jgi:hypothetical protein
LVTEQRHCEPGFRAQLLPLRIDRPPGIPSDVSANHTAQNQRAARQERCW